MIRDNHEPAASWAPVQRLCFELLDEVPELAADAAKAIRASQLSYASVPEAEHRSAVAEQLRYRLDALAERRGLTESELRTAADLAATRAAVGIPLDALIAAFQEGDRVVWRSVMERSSRETAPHWPLLGRLMFDAISATTTALASAHSQVTRAIDGGRMSLAYQLLEFLGDPASRTAAAVVATRLGLDPGGRFVGLVCAPDDPELDDAQNLASALQSASLAVAGRVVAGGQLEVLAQVETDMGPIRGYLEAQGRLGPWGIGMVRTGLTGAADTLRDARLALHVVPSGQREAWFATHWLEAIVLAEPARFDDLLADAIDTARADPHLAETVLTFAAADMSIARTAATVQLHANSVTYRLSRWSQLTGQDARTFDGLLRSVIACRIASLDGPS